MLAGSSGNTIHHNTITSADGAVGEAFSLTGSSNNIILFNEIDGHYDGVFLYMSNSNFMMYNTIENCDCGIYFLCPNNYNNYSTNYFDNNDDDYIFNTSYGTCTGNQ
jgi:parallel beta-helix repeat protein